MKLFNLLFGCELEGTEKLFYQGGAAYDAERKSLRFQAGETASFETYFNLFSYAKYRKYCGIQNADVRFEGTGSFLAEFFCRTQSGNTLPLQTVKFTDSYTVRLDISELPDKGYLYFTLTAESEAELTGGSYLADTNNDNPVKIGLVICTYKREAFVKNNLKRLLAGIAAEPEWGNVLHVFVIDNAKTLELPENEYYTVVPNKNLGGSGGFTRGITEVCKDPSFTHFLLMDDDIHFEFETLKRTAYLLRALSDEYKYATIGSPMMYLDRPTEQHEFGGYFTGLNYKPRNSHLDMTQAESLLLNEDPPQPNYTGWWYTCMPVQTVAKYSLPLPLFIKADDIEYGMRAIEHLILLSGIAIWHQDFTLKYNPVMDYYLKRNELILSTLRFKIGSFKQSLKFLYSSFIQLALKRYFCAELIIKAYQDFFSGYQFLIEQDMEKLNREIMNYQPQFYDKAELEQRFHVDIAEGLEKVKVKNPKRNIFRKAILTIENFMPSFLFRKKPIVVDANSTRARPLFLKKTSIHYDTNREQGYICEFDSKRRQKIRRRIFGMYFRILFKYRKLKAEYQKHYPETCSLEEWNRKFEI